MVDDQSCDAERPFPVLFVTSEAFPLAKTGGLADVCGALPAALARLGADLCIMLPGYPQALDVALDKRVLCDVTNCSEGEPSRLIVGRMPDSGCRVILFDCPALFRRDGGLYQDASGEDWPDNHRRFASFSRAAAAVAMGETALSWRPAVVHANDWHVGLLPAYLHFRGGQRPKTVFTAHNLAFQGNFPLDVFSTLKLPDAALSADGMEFYGKVSFLKAGLRYSDRLTTVSPNYAREILDPEHGCGMDGLLRSRAADLVGILNGVDYSVWDPAIDRALPSAYDADDMSGKATCKAALRAETGLANDEQAPLLIYVNRLTHQKMADVVLQAVPRVIANGAQADRSRPGRPRPRARLRRDGETPPGQGRGRGRIPRNHGPSHECRRRSVVDAVPFRAVRPHDHVRDALRYPAGDARGGRAWPIPCRTPMPAPTRHRRAPAFCSPTPR